MSNLTRKTTFNTAAALYEAVRPGYPTALVEDIVTRTGLQTDSRLLEVGCGTGKATRPFAARGYEMVCLDIGTELIGVARAALKSFPNVSFVQTAFEAWDSPERFDLVLSATAFHWIDSKVRYVKAAAALKPTGWLAVFNHHHVRKTEGFFAEVQSLYERYYLPPPTAQPTDETALPGSDAFRSPLRRVYRWSETYTAADYINLLSTYSDHIALPDANSARLFDGITHLIETAYHGQITKHYETRLALRKKQR